MSLYFTPLFVLLLRPCCSSLYKLNVLALLNWNEVLNTIEFLCIQPEKLFLVELCP